MKTVEPEIYDVVGIGFGPSNLAFAVALEDGNGGELREPLKAIFFERQPTLSWHRGMLVPAAKMQISFLKDLVTFRNPVSPFSFVSYLHDVDRLSQFVNNQDFFATRQEFHDYLEWAAAKLTIPVVYNSEVTGVQLPSGHRSGPVDYLRVEVRNQEWPGRTRVVKARNVVISTGLVPRMPFGIERDDAVWHSSEFLTRFRQADRSGIKRVAVLGGGQSAAEIVRFLYDTVPDARIFPVMPSYGYSIADSTPFANQIFDPRAVDDYYYGSAPSRDAFWRYHQNTNYAVVDDEVIRDLHRRVYDDAVAGEPRILFANLARVIGVKRAGKETRIMVHSMANEETYELGVDVLICATGYDSMEPSKLLGSVDRYCVRDEEGRHRVERDYRLVTAPAMRCGIYLQGGTEHTHGLSSSLLSNIAVRSGEILTSISASRAGMEKAG